LREHAASISIPSPPVVVQTANTDASDLLAIKNAGFEGFLSKPMDMVLLGEMIDRLVQRPAPPRRRQTRSGFRFSPGKIPKEK
jgi:CheY-like chemotaxis protein